MRFRDEHGSSERRENVADQSMKPSRPRAREKERLRWTGKKENRRSRGGRGGSEIIRDRGRRKQRKGGGIKIQIIKRACGGKGRRERRAHESSVADCEADELETSLLAYREGGTRVRWHKGCQRNPINTREKIRLDSPRLYYRGSDNNLGKYGCWESCGGYTPSNQREPRGPGSINVYARHT